MKTINNIQELIYSHRKQFLVFACLSIIIIGFTSILYGFDKQPLLKYISVLHPVLTFFLLSLIGFAIMAFFLSEKWFEIYTGRFHKGYFIIFILPILLAIIMIFVDLKITFPADINVLFPKSVLFYPAIAYLVEILFHLFPLVFLLLLFKPLINENNRNAIILICLIITAFLEPIYHLSYMIASNYYSTLALAYIGFHIFIINLVQLVIFRKYDFTSMYTFRLVYYLIWHIGWGFYRLKLIW